jgi:PEP-CTERM motif
MTKAGLGVAAFLLVFIAPCFSDTVIPVSGNAVVMIHLGTGNVLIMNGPGFHYGGFQPGGGGGDTGDCDYDTPCIVRASGEVSSIDWSYPGFSSDMVPFGPAADATFSFLTQSFTIPNPCGPGVVGCTGPVFVTDIPATLSGDILFPTIKGGFLDAKVYGVGPASFSAPDIGSWYEDTMSFTGEAVITPEPGTIGLMALGLLGVLYAMNRKRISYRSVRNARQPKCALCVRLL